MVSAVTSASVTDPRVDYLSLLRLDGQGFVVLGAGQGIGVQACLALSQAGARVLCVDRDEVLATAIASEVGGVPCVAEVTSREDMERVFSTARDRFGRVDGVVDIVGISTIGLMKDLDDTAWAHQFDVVLRHAFLALQIGGPLIAEGGGGSLTFVGSMAGDRAVKNQLAYSVAKAALHHLVRSAALELGPSGVRVNAVAPGFIRTPRLNARLDEEQWSAIGRSVPLGRAATPAEIAATLLFLSSGLSSHVTGQVLAVDGGTGVVGALPDLKFGPPP